jgi:hypothetical protein
VRFDWERLREDVIYRASLTSAIKTNETLRDEGKLVCKTNLLALCYVLGYTKINPQVHREALEFFLPRDLQKPYDQQGEGQKKRGTLLYPRGTFKTTIDEADTVQEVICFPEVCTVFLLCANQNLADALVDNVGFHFVVRDPDNPTLFQALFTDLCIGPPRGGSFSGRFSTAKRQQQPPIKESAVMGFSVEAGVSGWHCRRFKGDDMANNRNMRTAKSQADVDRNYNINRKMLMPGGIEDKMGTRYGPFDPYGMELSKVRPDTMRYIVKPALRRLDGSRIDLNGFPNEEDVELLFEPLGLTYEYLQTEYEADPASFMTQFMNDAHGAHEVVFDPQVIASVSRPGDEMPLGGSVYIAWRFPCKSFGFTNASAMVGMLEGGRMYLVDAVYGTLRMSTLAMKVVSLAKKWGHSSIEVEDSPGARHVESAIKNYALTLGWPIFIQWTPSDEASERDLRIKGLEPKIAGSRVIISTDLAVGNKLYAQLTTYGMMEENALPDVASRVAAHLPASIAMQEDDSADNDLAWEQMKERDMYNRLHGAGEYAPQQDEEESEEEPFMSNELQPNPWGYDAEMPGLMG